MSALRYDLFGDSPNPKRGDLLRTNVGDKRERTWFILHARRIRPTCTTPRRFMLTIVRWWEIEPDMRIKLWQSAERNGGQGLYDCKRYPAKKKTTFEDLMRRQCGQMAKRDRIKKDEQG